MTRIISRKCFRPGESAAYLPPAPPPTAAPERGSEAEELVAALSQGDLRSASRSNISAALIHALA